MQKFVRKMKSGKPRLAPKVGKYDMKNNFMREKDVPLKRKSSVAPLVKKRLA